MDLRSCCLVFVVIFTISFIIPCQCNANIDDENDSNNNNNRNSATEAEKTANYKKLIARMEDLEIEPLFILRGRSPTSALKFLIHVLEEMKEVHRKAYILVEGEIGSRTRFLNLLDKMTAVKEQSNKVLIEISSYDGTEEFDSFYETTHAKGSELVKKLENLGEQFETALDSLKAEEASVVFRINGFNELTHELINLLPILATQEILEAELMKKGEVVEEQDEDTLRENFKPKNLQTEETRNKTLEILQSYYAVYKEMDQILDKLRPYKDFKRADWFNVDPMMLKDSGQALKRFLELEKALEAINIRNTPPIHANDIIEDINVFTLKTEGFKEKLDTSMDDLAEDFNDIMIGAFEATAKIFKELKSLSKGESTNSATKDEL